MRIRILSSSTEDIQGFDEFYERDAQEVKDLLAEMSGITEKLESKIERWTELEERA